jgi:hypothetical protein
VDGFKDKHPSLFWLGNKAVDLCVIIMAFKLSAAI